MKHIAGTLVVVTFASVATAALPADTPYPASVQQETPLSTEFPNAPTYKQEHRNDAGQQSRSADPRAAGSAATAQSKADEAKVTGSGSGVAPADSARGGTY